MCSNKKKLFFILTPVILLIVVAIIGYYLIIPNKSTLPPQKPVTTVSVSKLHKQKIALPIITYGKTIIPTEVTLQSQVNASIAKINFKPGEHVKKGQLLFELTPTDITNQLKRLSAKLELSKEQFDRLQKLNELYKGGVSTIDLIQAKTNYQQDLSQLQDAHAIYQIVAPIDGVISDTFIAIGDFVQTGTSLAKITPDTNLQLIYQISSDNISKLKLNQKVLFYPNNSAQSYTAHVSYIAASLDPQTYNLQLRADFDQHTPLLANTFGKVEQFPDAQNVFLVAQNLVQTDSKGFFVYTLANGKVTKQYVLTGLPLANGKIVINSGVNDWDILITSNPNELSEGQSVKVKS
ncbi:MULTISPECIES: efflux RND transporter periplasmic adaptor subunit [Cysteiniphilum]|uniref:MexH family multidrug efflux RND transporter periplasmic adaptor subunit n=1 Tax=Cysteiniphilum litorale TaxID=2056700 RepID=A0A8J2Z2F6_9GAMM|nr:MULTISPECIES: efflux RND transporter periplasmic adaptor subunit [Cysteiniphilum]GGF88212.1 MexH family multidrug efflux RND transporter periplasmic adaptor subunit [Cysteiniphilum litorale]